jgi:hypothetical protein
MTLPPERNDSTILREISARILRYCGLCKASRLAMLCHAFLVVTATEPRADATNNALITLTVNEFRRLFDASRRRGRVDVSWWYASHPGQPVTPTQQKVGKLQLALKGLPAARDLAEAFEITRSLPHGHVAAGAGQRTATGPRGKGSQDQTTPKRGNCRPRADPPGAALCPSESSVGPRGLLFGCCPERMDALQLI